MLLHLQESGLTDFWERDDISVHQQIMEEHALEFDLQRNDV